MIQQTTFYFTKLDVLGECQGEREGLMKNNNFPTKILYLLKVLNLEIIVKYFSVMLSNKNTAMRLALFEIVKFLF